MVSHFILWTLGLSPSRHKLLVHFLLLSLIFIASGLLGSTLSAKESSALISSIAVRDLPAEAKITLQKIKQGGPFPYPKKDGSVFANHEQLLPKQTRGYYTQYTVQTPGIKGRGARRIIAGKGSTGQFATSGEYYYTDDHYNSFKRIVE
ncbi:MAG: ribonuclease [Burkholderiaceae bacterium]|nr:ribonuclease [Burkholderiaceae bacterium]